MKSVRQFLSLPTLLSVLIIAVLAVESYAADLPACEGSVLQRRFALVQFGKVVDSYIASQGSLPDICQARVPEIINGVPNLLKHALLCGSTQEKAVHYSCLLTQQPSEQLSANKIIERCNYSLENQAVSCENKSLVTVIE